MNEAETRAELIDPELKACGWGVIDGSKIFREHPITNGNSKVAWAKKATVKADYILAYNGIKLAIVEAKKSSISFRDGIAQAKLYAQKLCLETAYATNGKEIYFICLKTGQEQVVSSYLNPTDLWDKTFAHKNEWREKFAAIPFESKKGAFELRYYQEIAVQKTLEAIAQEQNRILLTLATGTGKTAIAFQIAWKLFFTKWNLQKDEKRRPRILFLADRNILASQAYNSFSSFPADALVRIKPSEIKKDGVVPVNGNIFFTIFQTFMSGKDEEGKEAPYFGQYPPDFFDVIIVDECHRGGANNEGNWRKILEYFSEAYQIGLTATPKKNENVDTYNYFKEPVYIYSLKDGVNDGFLTPFKVKTFTTTIDNFIYTKEDKIIEGVAEEGQVYKSSQFNRDIELIARDEYRIKVFFENAIDTEKTIIFCANQPHAALIRDLVNQYHQKHYKNHHIDYCVRVTSNDGEIGETYLASFQDNDKSIPTILTTSQKLSTGVDARNVRNIVLFRPVNDIIEFKQIIGRGTRLFDGKEYFTIYDFEQAYLKFNDPQWEEPICTSCGQEPCICNKEPVKPCKICNKNPCVCKKEPPTPCEICGKLPCECIKKVKIELSDGKKRTIQHTVNSSFWSVDGKPISSIEFMERLFGVMPDFFKSEDELRKIWGNPLTRKTLLQKLEDAGFGKDELTTLQKIVNLEKSDLFDVLDYVFNGDYKPITREERVNLSKSVVFALLNEKQREFIDFVMAKYVEIGVDELDADKLPTLIINKYNSLPDGLETLGSLDEVKNLFYSFQEQLYNNKTA